jgi:hypothetical protein
VDEAAPPRAPLLFSRPAPHRFAFLLERVRALRARLLAAGLGVPRPRMSVAATSCLGRGVSR